MSEGALPSVATTAREWQIITCEYPPSIGGVSDYTFTLAASLATVRPAHVWCPHGDGPAPASPGVVVHPDLNGFAARDLRRVGAQLNDRPGPRLLFVQWVPQGFGYRSVNVGFAIWLACRAWMRHDDLHLMVHEPFLPLSFHPLRLCLALLQRLMLVIASSGASHIWLSTASWESRVRPYVRNRIPIQWLPVPAPRSLTTTAAQADPHRPATEAVPVVGHFGTHSPLVARELAPALDVILRDSTARVMLIGRGSDRFRETFLETRPHAAGRVQATGVLAPAHASARLLGCDLMIQPYPDGVTSRRTSTLALLALGLAVVTNTGHLTEPFWSGCGAVQLAATPNGARLGEAAVALLDKPSGRAALSARAREMYDQCFDARYAVAMLEAAAWPPSDSDVEISAANAARRRA